MLPVDEGAVGFLFFRMQKAAKSESGNMLFLFSIYNSNIKLINPVRPHMIGKDVTSFAEE